MKQSRYPFAIPDRPRRGHPDGLDTVVDPVTEEIEAASAEAVALECRREHLDQLVDVARDGLGRPDRFGEDPLRSGLSLVHNGNDRF